MSAAGPHPSTENLVVTLRSILEPLNTKAIFPVAQPLEVELGCGDGSFLLNYAKQHPGRNFIGVERLSGRIRKIDRKGRRAGLKNLRGVRIESSYFLEYLLPRQSAVALHVYFPDPWPKRKHWKHRFINERFPETAKRALADHGIVYLRTDDKTYFEQMQSVFAASTSFRAVETPAELSGFVTDFEADFIKLGVHTLRAAYQVI